MIEAAWLRTRPVAHRGLHDNKLPENSLGAFAAAAEEGYPFELDVHLTKDGKLAVLHDYNTAGMTGIDCRISDLDSSVLKDFKLAGTEFSIPLLSEVFEVVNGRVPILVELKTESLPGDLEIATHIALREYMWKTGGEIAIESFNPLSMRKMVQLARKDNMKYTAGFLSKVMKKRKMPWPEKKILEGCHINALFKPDFLAYDISDMPHAFLEKRRVNGMPILGWLVVDENDKKWAEKYCDNYAFEGIRP